MVHMISFTEQKQTHRELTYGCRGGGRGEERGKGQQGVGDQHGHTTVFRMKTPQGPRAQHRGHCSMSSGSLGGRGVWGRVDTCNVWLSPSAPEAITKLLISYLCAWSLSQLHVFLTPWTVAHQAPLLIGFSKLEYWTGLPCPPSGMEPRSPALQADSLPSEPPEKSN